MLRDLFGFDHLVAMMGCALLILNEALKGFPEHYLPLLAENDPFMCLSPELCCNTINIHLSVLWMEGMRAFPREASAASTPVGQRSLGGKTSAFTKRL